MTGRSEVNLLQVS